MPDWLSCFTTDIRWIAQVAVLRSNRGHLITFCSQGKPPRGHFILFCPFKAHPRVYAVLFYLEQKKSTWVGGGFNKVGSKLWESRQNVIYSRNLFSFTHLRLTLVFNLLQVVCLLFLSPPHRPILITLDSIPAILSIWPFRAESLESRGKQSIWTFKWINVARITAKLLLMFHYVVFKQPLCAPPSASRNAHKRDKTFSLTGFFSFPTCCARLNLKRWLQFRSLTITFPFIICLVRLQWERKAPRNRNEKDLFNGCLTDLLERGRKERDRTGDRGSKLGWEERSWGERSRSE